MKKWFLALFTALLLVVFAVGCMERVEPQNGDTPVSVEEEKDIHFDEVISEEFPVEFIFSSGAGAWSTFLTLKSDGSFVGSFSDTNMGDSGEDYLATTYVCEFDGNFTNLQKVDDNSYTMELGELNIARDVGEEWIEGEIKYVSAEPYGLDGSGEFTLYLPDTPIDELSEEMLSWWPGRWSEDEYKSINCYGICDNKQGYGFFTDLSR